MAGAPPRTIVDFTVGEAQGLKINADGSLNVKDQSAPVAANVLDGFNSQTATQAATTLLTVPQGRTWKGVVGASCSVAVSGGVATEGQADVVFSVTGAGVIPATFAPVVRAHSGANVAAGTVGSEANNFGSFPATIIAPAGNSVAIQTTITIAGTHGFVDAYAIGELQ